MTVAALISACGGQQNAPGAVSATTPTAVSTATSVAALLTPGVNATDRAFADALLAQSPWVERLVQLARTNSDTPALIELADGLAISEKQQSETINALLVQWTDGEEGGQGPPPTGPTLFKPGVVEHLESLRGPEFDKLWLQIMLNHHQAVTTMAASEIKEGEDINAKTLAQGIMTTRQAETERMQKLSGGG
jgi:uncharacterized protein (DUF305 family)